MRMWMDVLRKTRQEVGIKRLRNRHVSVDYNVEEVGKSKLTVM